MSLPRPCQSGQDGVIRIFLPKRWYQDLIVLDTESCGRCVLLEANTFILMNQCSPESIPSTKIRTDQTNASLTGCDIPNMAYMEA